MTETNKIDLSKVALITHPPPQKKKIIIFSTGKKLPSREDDTWYSIFPVENEDLVYGRWG